MSFLSHGRTGTLKYGFNRSKKSLWNIQIKVFFFETNTDSCLIFLKHVLHVTVVYLGPNLPRFISHLFAVGRELPGDIQYS